MKIIYIMHRTGFEPARLTPSELESDPLDHSGTYAMINVFIHQ